MTALVQKLHSYSPRPTFGDVLYYIRSFEYAVRQMSVIRARNILFAASVVFVIIYVSAAYFTLYEGERFAQLQRSIRQKELEQVKNESLLTDLLSVK